jgi:hypothetical protein
MSSSEVASIIGDLPINTQGTPFVSENSAKASFMSINQHCRDIIRQIMLQNKARSCDSTIMDHDVEPISLRIPRVPGEDADVPRYTISNTRIHNGNVNILLVSRQLCSEGTEVLYGRNSFVSYNFPQLKHRLPAVVSCRNMRLIRKVTLGPPMKHKRAEPTAYLGGFLEFLKEKLPNLSDMTLTTQFNHIRRTPTNFGDRAKESLKLGMEVQALMGTTI